MRANAGGASEIFVIFYWKPLFYPFCEEKMGATVAPISKKLGANSRLWGPLALWPRFFPSLLLQHRNHSNHTMSNVVDLGLYISPLQVQAMYMYEYYSYIITPWLLAVL